jgi:hypothetical protein
LRIKPQGPTTVPSIVCEVRRNRARLAQYRIIQTIRILSRSHRRFTEERKVKVIRSLIKETRITATGIEFEMYIEPTERAVEISAEENAQENFPHNQVRPVRVGCHNRLGLGTQSIAGQVAKVRGISPDLLGWRIKVGTYPAPPHRNGDRDCLQRAHPAGFGRSGKTTFTLRSLVRIPTIRPVGYVIADKSCRTRGAHD